MAGHQERAPLVCLISGVKTELGRTIAYTFAEEGGRVILVGETEDREELGRIGRRCGCVGAPSTVDIHPVQLHNKQTVDQLCYNLLSRQGELDILVNNPEGNPGTWDREILLIMVGHFASVMGERGRGVTLINLEHEEPMDIQEKLAQYKNLTVVHVKKNDFDTPEKIRTVLKEKVGLGNGPPVEPPIVSGDAPVHNPFGGIIEATGARMNTGLLQRKTAPDELNKAVSDYCGAVMQPVDPNNLEPEEHHEYQDESARTPDILVQCYKPFNGEPPHRVLVDKFITPNELHYVRNHLPVPSNRGTIATHRITVEADPEFNLRKAELTVDDLKSKFEPVTLTVTLQCAGNRRNDMCAVETVSGRAPWNAGSISNAEWTGVRVRDLARYIGLDPDKAAQVGARWVTSTGLDYHRKTQMHFETSISVDKAFDVKGDVIVAYAMNGKELPPDHGYPVRLVVPGYVGARSTKWLQRILISASDSQSPWQQVDYRPAPSSVKVHEQAEPPACPPLMGLPVQSAILMPLAGSIIAADQSTIRVKGYAWSGCGRTITRVDVSWDEGRSWTQAKITDQLQQPEGRAWAWVLWELMVPIPDDTKAGGRLTLMCKAFDETWNTQPRTAAEIWNYRGLNCNSWHTIPVCIQPGGHRQGVVSGLLETAEQGLKRLGVA